MAASQVGNGERAAMTGSNVGDTGHWTMAGAWTSPAAANRCGAATRTCRIGRLHRSFARSRGWIEPGAVQTAWSVEIQAG